MKIEQLNLLKKIEAHDELGIIGNHSLRKMRSFNDSISEEEYEILKEMEKKELVNIATIKPNIVEKWRANVSLTELGKCVLKIVGNGKLTLLKKMRIFWLSQKNWLSNRKKTIYSILGLVGVGAAGIAIYFFMNNTTTNQENKIDFSGATINAPFNIQQNNNNSIQQEIQ